MLHVSTWTHQHLHHRAWRARCERPRSPSTSGFHSSGCSCGSWTGPSSPSGRRRSHDPRRPYRYHDIEIWEMLGGILPSECYVSVSLIIPWWGSACRSCSRDFHGHVWFAAGTPLSRSPPPRTLSPSHPAEQTCYLNMASGITQTLIFNMTSGVNVKDDSTGHVEGVTTETGTKFISKLKYNHTGKAKVQFCLLTSLQTAEIMAP